MKKTIAAAILLTTLVLACQKEAQQPNMQQPGSVSEDYIVGTNPADSVIFFGWSFPELTLTASSDKYSPLFGDRFRVTDSTNFYFKKAVFKLRIGASVNATKARLYVDGNRNTVPLEAFVTGDSIVFINKTPQRLVPADPKPYEHLINMQVLATGDTGDTMRARLVYVVVVNKTAQPQYRLPQSQITGLPEISSLGKF
jgi:hypothetical protein